MEHSRAIRIGYSDYGDVWIKRVGESLVIKRYHPLDYAYMEEYINDNHDTLRDWQDAVYNGNTQESYDSRMQDYEYDYDEYFDYDGDTEEYYNSYDSDYEAYTFGINQNSREDFIARVREDFEDTFNDSSFEAYTGFNLESTVGQIYDECKKYQDYITESRKPHWNAFSYYK